MRGGTQSRPIIRYGITPGRRRAFSNGHYFGCILSALSRRTVAPFITALPIM